MEEVNLPAGRHAALRCKGPYSGHSVVYTEPYCDWLPASAETPANSLVLEIYLNATMDMARHELPTEFRLPLA